MAWVDGRESVAGRMPIAGAVEGKAKECVLCGALVRGDSEGMDAHAATSCIWNPGKPSLSLDMDSR
jgi:hypothetical protein